MNIRTNSVVNKINTGSPELPNGVTVTNSSPIICSGNLTISGVATVGFTTAKNANISGSITAITFFGDGSQLTVDDVGPSKSIALKYIFADHPHRS